MGKKGKGAHTCACRKGSRISGVGGGVSRAPTPLFCDKPGVWEKGSIRRTIISIGAEVATWKILSIVA